MQRHRQGRRGFTLVELLVVIAIIGVLMAMLIPAVQYARETARRSSCGNHLRQIGLAVQQHNTQWQIFPTAGSVTPYARAITGIPPQSTPRGAKQQTWGWAYQILPYLELESAWKINDFPAALDNDKAIAQTVVSGYFCPSRRRAEAIDTPAEPSASPYRWIDFAPTLRGQLDYAGNGGTAVPFPPDPLHYTLKQNGTVIPHFSINGSGVRVYFDNDWVGLGNIKDGASSTLLVGERNWNRALRDEDNPRPPDEDNGFIAGYDMDTIRWGYQPPIPDRDDPSLNGGDLRFGASHSSVCQFVFADGAVHGITYQVDAVLFRAVAGREDPPGTRSPDPSEL